MSENVQTKASPEEIENVIGELEQYRQRIVDDSLEMAKKAKIPKKEAMKHLEGHPEIAKIDAALAQLRSPQEDLPSPSTVQ
ncbi:MAG: acetyltransferase [Moorea sp. SIO2B7]|nr:acetyltransferase [Moorena sp. SIO2B7]